MLGGGILHRLLQNGHQGLTVTEKEQYMKKERIKLTAEQKLLQKKEKQKKNEKKFTVIAIVAVALIILTVLVILATAIGRTVIANRKPSTFDVEELYGSWYDDTGKIGWHFEKEYVYFLNREDTEEPFASRVYTAYKAYPDLGKMDVYLKKNTPTTYTCTLKNGVMTLVSGEETLKLTKGMLASELNMLILGITPAPFDMEEFLATGWRSEDGMQRWIFAKDGSLQIFTRAKDSDPFTLKEEVGYTAKADEGLLQVTYGDGSQKEYTCTIRNGKLRLIADSKRTVFVKESTTE